MKGNMKVPTFLAFCFFGFTLVMTAGNHRSLASSVIQQDESEVLRPEGWTEETHGDTASPDYDAVFAQDVVKIRITEGMPMIPVAIPEFQVREGSVPDDGTRLEIYQVLHDDLKYSRVFKVVPKEYYSYIQTFDPKNIRFKDWASIQANILFSGSVEVSAEDRVVFAVKVYDVISEKFIFGRK